MLSIIRSGPKILIMESKEKEKIKNYFQERFGSPPCTLDEAFEESSEEYTILLLVENLKEIVHRQDIQYVFLLKEDSDVVLCLIHNDQDFNLTGKIRIAPRILLMRALGDIEKIIQQIQKDHQAKSGSFLEMIDNHNSQGTILALTEQPLNKKLSLRDLYPKTLFIKEKYAPLRKSIRIHGLKYLNEGLDNRDWYELEIKIYDKYEAYMLHYQRLLKFIQYLELGIILGESWGQDSALIFKNVGVYRIRFFTFYDPPTIKRFLIGLEYLEDGMRIVDYDVFYKRKKIYWTDVREKNIREKSNISEKYRQFLFAKLEPGQLAEIKKLEEEILKSRQ